MNSKTEICVLFSTFLFLSFTIIIAPASNADRGGIAISHVDIPLSEPEQKAIICWDGEREMLVLSTDIKAGQTTKALEILPLPSEPQIKTVNETMFTELKEMVEWRGELDEGGKGADRGDLDAGEQVDVKIVFHKRIGVHNITVIEAFTTDGFAGFVSAFMQDIGLEPMSFPEAESIAESYMNRDINFFVLDVIELSTSVQSPQPLMFSFDSDSVYYPMEITSLTGGNTHIIMFILTPYSPVGDDYWTGEDSFFSEKRIQWQDERIIEPVKPGSPVNFKRLLVTNVHREEFRYEAEYYDDYNYDSIKYNDLIEIFRFFEGTSRINIGVYEYEGPVKMQGDIDIGNYSISARKLDLEVEVKPFNVILLLFVPPVVIFILIIIVIIYISRKGERYRQN